jgi:dienelactone hydrolase
MAACGPVLHIGIPAPSGAYAIGRTTFALVDSSRVDPWSAAGERRNVLVKAWYPATITNEARATYLDNSGRLPGEFQFGERWIVGRLDSHARVGPPAASPDTRLPVVLFSPGADTPPEYYTALLEELASRGYVILAIDHAYEGRGQILPDGRVLGVESERHRPPRTGDAAGEARQFQFYAQRVAARAADASFVIDALQHQRDVPPSITKATDISRVGALGHSLGGVAAAEICRRDPRVRSCAVIDGLVRGLPVLPASNVAGPHSLLYVGKPIPPTRISPDSGWVLVRRAIAENGGGYDVLVSGATHTDFTDTPFLTPTVHPVEKRARLQVLRDVVGAFFDKTLLGKQAPLLDDSTAARPSGVRITRVEAMRR